MYLGWLLSLSNIQEVELTHRLERAWKKLMVNKAQLCSKDFRLVDSLNLLNAVVTSTALYGSETWRLTVAQDRNLQVAQRRMLPWMVGVTRKRSCEEDVESEGSTSSQSEPERDEDVKAAEVLERQVDWI